MFLTSEILEFGTPLKYLFHCRFLRLRKNDAMSAKDVKKDDKNSVFSIIDFTVECPIGPPY